MLLSMSIGKPYYVNTFTKESVWERPTEPAQPSSERVFNLLHCIILMLVY